jgi:HAD superfamily hydrolase (TIGR01509 family)
MKTILVDAINAFLIPDMGIFSEMHEMLEQYPNKKIILTSANDEQKKEYGLVNMPYEVFSLNHNPEKDDPEYFRLMLKHFNLNADDVVYFDNRIEAVKSAQSIGINAFHYDKNKRDLVALKQFIDKNL